MADYIQVRQLILNRDSVCMGDDCNSHVEMRGFDEEMKLSVLLQKIADHYLPFMKKVIWAVRIEDKVCGYIVTDEETSSVELAENDMTVKELEADKIYCVYYYERSFYRFNRITGESVEQFEDCKSFLEKVKRKEAFEKEAKRILKDMTSKDDKRIWRAASEIIHLGQEPERIRPLIYHIETMKKATQGIEMGGFIMPNKRLVDFAIKTLEFHRNEQDTCPCHLYAKCSEDSIFEPEKEETKGYVTILNTIYDSNHQFINYYVVKCNKCGQTYYAKESWGHMRCWKWIPKYRN